MRARLCRWLFPVCPTCGEDLYLIGFGEFCFSDRCRFHADERETP